MESQKDACKDFILATIRFFQNRRKVKSGIPPGINFKRIHTVVAATLCPENDYRAACRELIESGVLLVVGRVAGTEELITDLPEGFLFCERRSFAVNDKRIERGSEAWMNAVERGDFTSYAEVRAYVAKDGLPPHLKRLLKRKK